MEDHSLQELAEEHRRHLEGIIEVEEDVVSDFNVSSVEDEGASGTSYSEAYRSEEDADDEGTSTRPSSSRAPVLRPFERTFALSVLKDAVNQLIIVNNGEKNVHPSFDKKKPAAERLKEPIRDNLFHARTLGKVKDVMDKMVLVKLRNDT